jgi:hypothetical protein
MLQGENPQGLNGESAAAAAPATAYGGTPMVDAFAMDAGGGATGVSTGTLGQQGAAAGQDGSGDSREAVGTIVREMGSLVQLRLLYLEALGCEDVYLSLAMGAKMWSEAVSSLLKSKDRWVMLEMGVAG